MSNDTQMIARQRVDHAAMISGLSANYFILTGEISRLSEIDFAAAPDTTGVVGAIDHATGNTPFWAGGPSDAFAVQYTGALVVETAGLYTFRLISDDGSVLRIDGARVIDNDGLHAATTRLVTLDLEAGIHPLEVLYFERGGVQTLKLEWQGPDTGDLLHVLTGDALVHDPLQSAATEQVAIAEPSAGNTGLTAAYFSLPPGVSSLSQVDFTAAPDATAVVGALDMMKSDTPFWAGGPNDNFAARYDGTLVVETAGRYTLYLTSDDGSALYLDGERVIDNDGLHAAATRQVTLDLSAGRHALEVLYFERTGHQTLTFDWQGPDTGGLRKTVVGAALEHEATPVIPVENPVDPVTPPPQFRVSDAGYDLVEFAADEQGTGPAEIGPDGRSVTMAGDDWKAIEGSFTITADTVLRFTYAADVEGEIHGIGFANADATMDLMPERGGTGALFQLGGVTRDWGIENAAWDYAFGSGEATFEIAVGKYLEGTFDRMVFVMDDDAGRGSSATFADVELVAGTDETPADEAPKEEPAAQFRVSDAGYDLVEFAADAQGTGPAEIGPDGRSVTMAGDDWKAIEGSFTITADTVLRFTYAADVEGEIHGIGFANADATMDLMPERGGSGALFQLGGVTRDWGIENAAWDYAFGSGETTFEIAVGKYLEGTFDRMVFVMDDDAGRGSSATFSNIEFGVNAPEPEPRNTAPDAIDDTFATDHGDPLVLSVSDLLTNDSDADGDVLTVTDVTAVTGGTATLTGDTILFTPDAGFDGTAKFEYSVSDGVVASTATASVQVAPPALTSSSHAGALLAAVSEGVGLADPSLAVGLDSFSYWKSPPFLNLMKQAGVEGIRDSAGNYVPLAELVEQGYVDANGYPVTMYPGNEMLSGWQQGYGFYVSIHHQNDFVRQETSGDYVVEWSGAGEIELRGFNVTSREIFQAADGSVTGGQMTGTWGYGNTLKTVRINDTDPEGTGNYIRDISIVRAEYKDMYDAGAIFDPRYTALIEDHHTLRFMDWMETNGSDVKSLADVASMDSATWAGSVNASREPEVNSSGLLPVPAQVPFEVMVQLANEVGADPWFNIPLKADDDYVRKVAAYVEEYLDDGLKAKFELSNEVWNWAYGFEQTREASLLGSGGASSGDIRAAREHYGYRSAEIRSILDEEMSRIDAEMILGTQTVYLEIAKWAENGVNQYFSERGATGKVSDVFDHLAITGYFNGIVYERLKDLRAFWQAESEGAFESGKYESKYDYFVNRAGEFLLNGREALTDEEESYIIPKDDGSLGFERTFEEGQRDWIRANKAMADDWGLDLIHYEADSHDNKWRESPEAEWFKAYNKSLSMAEATTRMAKTFREEGGILVNDYGHLGDSADGLWGTRAHMADENPISEAYDAYNATAAAEFGSINTGRDPSAFLHGVTENGTAGVDTLIGTAQRDYLVGGDGNDLLVGGPGNDGLHGGAGIDMVLFDGNRDEFAFRTDGDMLIVSGPTGEDRLVDVELLAFAGSREFVRASDLTDDAPIADLADLLAQFDTEHGVLTHFF